MLAFVMSGGGNRGALEAGALQELFEAGLKPDMVVGTSAGALNAAFIATDPTLHGARCLTDIWLNAKKDDFFPGGIVQMLGRLAQGKSLFPNDALQRAAEKFIPSDKRYFRDVQGIKLYITAANLNTGRLYVWGDQPDASIIDAAIASAAHPLAFPPVKYQDHQLIDGGAVANVPVGLAIDKGATEVYILNVGNYSSVLPDQGNIIQVLLRTMTVMMNQPFLLDLKFATKRGDVKLHHIAMTDVQSGELWEMDKTAEMVEVGRRTARDYLNNPTGLGNLDFAVTDFETPPPGADVYRPTWMR